MEDHSSNPRGVYQCCAGLVGSDTAEIKRDSKEGPLTSLDLSLWGIDGLQNKGQQRGPTYKLGSITVGYSGLQNKGQQRGTLISLDLSLWGPVGYRTKDSEEGCL